MKRVFLDANILFSAAYRENAGLQRLWHVGGVRLLSSDYAIQEAVANLADMEQRVRLDDLLRQVSCAPSTARLLPLPPGADLPEKDAPILQAALQARADVLLTGDVAHFGRYFGKRIGSVLVQRPADFLREASAS